MLSIRSNEHKLAGRIHIRRIESYTNHQARSWKSDAFAFNADASLTTYLGGPGGINLIYVLPDLPVQVLVILDSWPELVAHLAKQSHVRWKIVGTGANPAGGRAILIASVRNKSEYEAVFGGQYSRFVADGAVLGFSIGQDIDSIFDGIVGFERSPFAQLITQYNFLDVIGFQGSSVPNLIYSIRFNAAYNHDVNDPRYTVSAEYYERMYRHLEVSLTASGFEVITLPYRESLIANWIGFGELSLIDQVFQD